MHGVPMQPDPIGRGTKAAIIGQSSRKTPKDRAWATWTSQPSEMMELQMSMELRVSTKGSNPTEERR